MDSGADALTLINTYPAMKIDIQTRRPALGWGSGGMSGPALKPIAIRLVYLVAKAVRVPLVGCGGVTTAEDAIEFLMAGASAVQIGTATFRNPRAALHVLEGVETWLKAEGVEDVSEVIGAALPDAALTPTAG